MSDSSFCIQTERGATVTDITRVIDGSISNTSASICVISIPHTTAAVAVLTNEKYVSDDVITMLESLVPVSDTYKHASPSHVAAHFFSAMIGTSVVLPIKDRRLKLGEFQRLVLIDFEGPSTRRVDINYGL